MKRNQSTIIFVTAGKWQLGGIKIAKKMGYKILCIDEDKNAEGFKISNFTSEPTDLPIQFRCRSLTLSGQSTSSSPSNRDSA